jgi:hypothetical protein
MGSDLLLRGLTLLDAVRNLFLLALSLALFDRASKQRCRERAGQRWQYSSVTGLPHVCEIMTVIFHAMRPERVLRLASGIEITVPDGETVEQTFWKHARLAAAEGICPHCNERMEPVPCEAGGAGGHCLRCRLFWRYDPELDECGWELDHYPLTGEPHIPDWGTA